MVLVELTDKEAQLLLDLAQKEFSRLDKLPGMAQSKLFDRYHQASGAQAVLHLALHPENYPIRR